MKSVNITTLIALSTLSLMPLASHATIPNLGFDEGEGNTFTEWTATPVTGVTGHTEPLPPPATGTNRFPRIHEGKNFKPATPFDCGQAPFSGNCTVTFIYRTHNNGDNPNPLRVTGSGGLDQPFPASAAWSAPVSVPLGLCGRNKTIQFASLKGQVDIDNVADSCNAVPEPGSMLALGAGLASLIAVRRRAKR